MAVWTEPAQPRADAGQELESPVAPGGQASFAPNQRAPAVPAPSTESPAFTEYGWPLPSAVSADSEQARASIFLPEFPALLMEKARVISSRFPFAEAQYRIRRNTT